MSNRSTSDAVDSLATRWSLISRARQTNPDERRLALGELLERYLPVLRSHLVVRRRLESHRADDLLQGFIADRILEKDWLAQADRAKGKFRSLLFRSLENFVIDQFRRDKHFPAASAAADDHDNDAQLGGVEDSSAPDVFDVAWARQVLDVAIERMRQNCRQDSRPWLWPLFDGRVLQPTLCNRPPVPYEELVERFAFESPAQASNALITVKRQFQKILETVVSEYLNETEDLAAELAELRRILSQSVGHVFNVPLVTSDGHVENVPHETTSRQLAGIFDVSADASDHWQPDDLGALLRHQLSAPLRATLCADERVARELASLPPPDRDEPQTFAELFQHSAPPLELLNAVKRWSKHAVRKPESAIPAEIATTLYYAALAAAIVHRQEHITTADAETLRYAFDMMLSQVWLTDELRTLFAAAYN